MNLMRNMIFCLSIAIFFAVSLNGVAMAASDLSAQTHCIGTLDDGADQTAMDRAHDHERVATKSADTPSGDNETCMMHACPALSAEATILREIAEALVSTLVWPEAHGYALERGDDLKRPPIS